MDQEQSAQFSSEAYQSEKDKKLSSIEEIIDNPLNLEKIKKIRSLFIDLQYETFFENKTNLEIRTQLRNLETRLIEKISKIENEQRKKELLYEILPESKEIEDEEIIHLNQELTESVICNFVNLNLSDQNTRAELIYRLALHDPEGFLKYFDQNIVRKLGIQEEVFEAILESKPELVADYFEKFSLEKKERNRFLEKYAQKHPREFLLYFNVFGLEENKQNDHIFKIKLLNQAIRKKPIVFHNLKNTIQLNKPEDKERFIKEAEQIIIGNLKREFLKLKSREVDLDLIVLNEEQVKPIKEIESKLFNRNSRLVNKLSPLDSHNRITVRDYILLKYGVPSLTKKKEKSSFFDQETETVTGWQMDSFKDIEDPLLNQKIALELAKFDSSFFNKINQSLWKDPKIILELIKTIKAVDLLSHFDNDYIRYNLIKLMSTKKTFYQEVHSLYELIKYLPNDEKLKKRLIKRFYLFLPREMIDLALKSLIKLDQNLAKKALFKEPDIYLTRYLYKEKIKHQKPDSKFPWKKIEVEETKKTYLDDLAGITPEEKKELTLKAAHEDPALYFNLLAVDRAKNLTQFEQPIFVDLVKKYFDEDYWWSSDAEKILKTLMYSDIPRDFFISCLKNGIEKNIDDYSLEDILPLDLSRKEIEPIIEIFYSNKPREIFLDISAYFDKYSFSDRGKLDFCKKFLKDHWKLVFSYEENRRSDIMLATDEKLHKELILELYDQPPLCQLSDIEYLRKIVEMEQTNNLGKCSPKNIELLNHIFENYPDEYSYRIEEILVLPEDILPHMNIEKYKTIMELDKKIEALEIEDRKIRNQVSNFHVFKEEFSWIIPYLKSENLDLVVEKLSNYLIDELRPGMTGNWGFVECLSDESMINCLYLTSNTKREDIEKTYNQLFSREGIINGAREELLRNFFKTASPYYELKKCQEVFTNPNLPLHKKLFYFTETYFNEFFESYGQKGEFAKDVEAEEFLEGDQYIKFATLSIQEKRACHKDKLKGLSDNQVQDLTEFVFKNLTIDFKKKVLEAKIKKTIEYSRSEQRKTYANQRNRVLKNVNQLAIAETLLHGTSHQYFSKMLQNGNLAGEAVGAKSEADSFPFHADFIRLDNEYIKEHKADFHQCLVNNESYNISEGIDRGIILIYNREPAFDIYEAKKEFPNDPKISKHYKQHFILGGIPSTEISGIVLIENPSSEELTDFKENIVLNGFYIPIYNKKGELLFDEDEYENAKTDLNINVIKTPILDQATNIGPQLGSNEGGTYLVPEQGKFNRYYFKFAPRERLWNEHLACQFYQELGLSAPETKIVYWDGKLALASKWIEQNEEIENDPDNEKNIQDGFIFDCWLGNWDITLNENFQLINNEIYRIDNGGALLFRAQGEDKVNFTNNVVEMETLRKRPEFYDIPQNYIAKQVERLKTFMSDDKIVEIVNQTQLTLKTREKLIDVLVKRRDYIVDNYKKLIR